MIKIVSKTKSIIHQLQKKDFYFPYWNIDILIIGTFNPSGGKEVDYYYGRRQNRFWSVLPMVYNETPIRKSYLGKDVDLQEKKLKFLEKHKIGCVDMINRVVVDFENVSKVTGKNYTDNNLYRYGKTFIFNTERIVKLISDKKVSKVYFTFGERIRNNEFQISYNRLIKFMNDNGIGYSHITSPSGSTRISNEDLRTDWKPYFT